MIVLEKNPVDINKAEIKWIKEIRDKGANLLNIADGGFNIKHSPETLTKMRNIKLGTKLSEETKLKLSEKAKLQWKNPEIRKTMSERIKSQWKNPKIRKAVSERIKLQWKSPEMRKIIIEKMRISAINRWKKVREETI